ncbi:unnamed protein product, partial [Iphiclides podalirius]
MGRVEGTPRWNPIDMGAKYESIGVGWWELRSRLAAIGRRALGGAGGCARALRGPARELKRPRVRNKTMRAPKSGRYRALMAEWTRRTKCRFIESSPPLKR